MFQVPVVDIYVTGACNLVCRYCFGESDKKPGMKRDAFLHALEFARHVGATAIELCGGEPLVYSDIHWAVSRARSEGFRLILRTNGLLLSKHRGFVVSNFDTVGVSLDGDATANHHMRPARNTTTWSALEKFEIPLAEIEALKVAAPQIRVILASIATKANLEGLCRLARLIVKRRVPIDLWKVNQFLPNNFRATENIDEFSLQKDSFQQLANDLLNTVCGAVPLIYRGSDEVDGSCLIIGADGSVLVRARSIGNVCSDTLPELSLALERTQTQGKIEHNKASTYAVWATGHRTATTE